MKKNIRGSFDDHNSITKSFKKQEKSYKKDLKREQINNDNFYKLASQALKKIDIKRIAKNMEDSSNSDSGYDFDSETSVKQ